MTLEIVRPLSIPIPERDDFLSQYLAYTDATECPVVYSRWAAIVGIGTLLGRSTWIQHGHFKIYPNMYAMLIGTSGARKSTTISIQKNILRDAGYTNIAADKSSKEKFLLDLAGEGDEGLANVDDFLFGSTNGDTDAQSSEILIAADEFNNFLGNGNIEFLSLLGVLWDYNGVYKNRIKSGKSVSINNPTVSILAGNTPTGFHLAFPPEALGQGFFSRLLMIYGEPRDRRYAFPEAPSLEATTRIIEKLRSIKLNCAGPVEISSEARNLLGRIYAKHRRIDDVRFDSYNTRRFSHLLKVCIIIHAASGAHDGVLRREHVIYANTILAHAELYMSKALGGFGKAKNSDVSHRVLMILDGSQAAMPLTDIWKQVQTDLEKIEQLAEIIRGLLQADKIMVAPGGKGFLSKKKLVDEEVNDMVDFNLLTTEEREMSI